LKSIGLRKSEDIKKKHGATLGTGEEEEEEALKRQKIEMEEVETKERVIDKRGKVKKDKDIVVKKRNGRSGDKKRL
jgi:hypothetical protein